MSQAGPGRRERIKSAYDELHWLTNSQGRLRLMCCLERGRSIPVSSLPFFAQLTTPFESNHGVKRGTRLGSSY